MAEIQDSAPRRYLSPDNWLKEHPGTLGRTLFYQSLKTGEIPHVRVGRRVLVPDDALDIVRASRNGVMAADSGALTTEPPNSAKTN
jgi:hypothetical protein